jgi:hypothetical protein
VKDCGKEIRYIREVGQGVCSHGTNIRERNIRFRRNILIVSSILLFYVRADAHSGTSPFKKMKETWGRQGE